MQHVANMDNRSLICSGFRVADNYMSDDDRAWATAPLKDGGPSVIAKDEKGRWYHTKITDRDRKSRASYWNPDTGPWRKGVNY
ncbi:hypothetical protein [Mesorhizobium sp. Cs1299R1N3]|uniref:hypothetical protein n=1 Tax=Mesorhizobium sp. Cs1299R1N3 TaxID=3015173 RepID=UPI00301CA00B